MFSLIPRDGYDGPTVVRFHSSTTQSYWLLTFAPSQQNVGFHLHARLLGSNNVNNDTDLIPSVLLAIMYGTAIFWIWTRWRSLALRNNYLLFFGVASVLFFLAWSIRAGLSNTDTKNVSKFFVVLDQCLFYAGHVLLMVNHPFENSNCSC
jgi:hypothetical protein